MDKHVDVNEVAAEAVDTEKKGKSGPTASERRADPTAGKKSIANGRQELTRKTGCGEDRKDPRSGSVAAKTRRGT